MDEYTGTLPSRTQDADTFDALAEAWARWFTNTAVPEINTSITELALASVADVYSSSATYNKPDVVVGSDGRRYPCIGTGVSDDDPVSSTTGNWGEPYGVSMSDFYDIYPGRNKIINGDFSINQDAVSGTVTLAYDDYGHDMFKGGYYGAVYTFETVENETTVTISSGSLVQTIYGGFLQSGTYVASWEGTAQVKIGTGAFGDSGVTGTAVGGTNLDIEIGTGTIKNLQIEIGTVSSVYEHRLNELSLCSLFYRRVDYTGVTYIGTGAISDPSKVTPRGTHVLGYSGGMIGSPVLTKSGNTYFSFLYGQTYYTGTIDMSVGGGWTGSTGTIGSQYDAIILVANSGAWIALSTRL